MNRSIFQIWRLTISDFRSKFNFKLFFINFISIFLIFLFLKINTLTAICESFNFFRPFLFENGEFLISSKTTASKLANAKINLLRDWFLPNKPHFLKFKNFNGLPFHRTHPLNHPNLIVHTDWKERLFWSLQVTHGVNPKFKHLFEVMLQNDILNNNLKQLVSVNFRVFLFEEVTPVEFETNLNDDSIDILNKKMLEIMFRNNLQPDWLCKNFNNFDWKKL